MIDNPPHAKTAVAAAFGDPIRDDFRNFLFVLWKHLGLRQPTGIQYDIGLYLQHGPRRRIIQAFRGIGKSWITAAFVLWRLLRSPNERILVVSANEDRALAFTTFCRRLIAEVPLLQHLAPAKGDLDAALKFNVGGSMPHQAPSLKAAGITGQITGSRASLIVADDIEVPKNSLTTVMRDRLSELVKEFDAIIMGEDDLMQIGLAASEVVYLGTPQTEDTLYRKLEGRGYRTRIWPARFPDAKLQMLYGDRLAPMLREMLVVDPKLATSCGGRGEPTEGTRFPDLDLCEREASYGRSGFALQFQLNPSLSDAERYPLKLADLMVMDCDPAMAPIKMVWASSPDLAVYTDRAPGMTGDRFYRPMWVSKENYVPYTGVAMAIDPAGRGGDELAYCVVAMLNGYLFLLRLRGLKGGYSDDNLQLLANEAKRFKVNHVRIESNFGDGMFAKLLTPFLQRTHPVAIEDERSSVQKEKRIIDTLEPVLNQHRLVVDGSIVKDDAENYNEYPEEVAHRYQLFHQMTRITREKGSLSKDDRIDVLAMAVAYWVEVLDKDQENLEADHKEAMRDLAVQQFLEGAGVLNPNRFGVMGEFFGGGALGSSDFGGQDLDVGVG